MTDFTITNPTDTTVEAVLCAELARGDEQIGAVAPILRYLLASEEHSLFSDEIIARVRGSLADVARQLLDELAAIADEAEVRNHASAQIDALVQGLVAHPGLLAHAHALAIEWQLTERLHSRLALDPVLPPLLQALVASTDPSTASNAMALLAAQARFAQAQRRLQLPLGELPGELIQAALDSLRSIAGESCEAAESAIRARYDEGRTRLGLIARLVTGMGGGATATLIVSHAGVGMFLSALALGSGQGRDVVAQTTGDGQLARLALTLRVAGLKPEAVEEQFASLHPEFGLPDGFELLSVDRAAAVLAGSNAFAGD